MKYIKIAFLSLFILSACQGMDQRELVDLLHEHQRSLNRDIIAYAFLCAGVAVFEGWKYLDECGNHCSASHYLPLVPGGLLIAHSLLSGYLPRK